MPNGKKKFLLISNDGDAGDLLWKIKNEGHEVKYFIGDKSNKDVCDGFVDKVDKWEDLKDWADVIIFDDINFGALAEKLRKEGKLVIGGSVYTDKLEIDRDFGYKEMIDAGINVIPSWVFTDFDEAIKFIQKNPDRYVIKPCGPDQSNQKELSFVGEEEDGKDVLQILEIYKTRWSKIVKTFQIQKFISGVEVAVGAFFNGEDFIYPININFEHKKLFPGNVGPSCYSEDTEILTYTGWKKFSEINYDDRIMSFNAEKKELIWEYPLKIFWMKYGGKMINFKNRYVDLLITPNHRMLHISKRDFYKKRILFRVNEAQELFDSGEFIILQASRYRGTNPEFFILPEYKDGRGYVNPKKEIEMIAWSRFMGWYLSEGSYFKNGVRIAQSKDSMHITDIINCLKALPFGFCQLKNGFKINSTQLSNYLKQFGHSHEKYVPDYIKNGSEEVIRKFLEEFNKGDGDLHDGQRRYCTNSFKLISDIQEMLIKLGISSTITKDKRTKSTFHGSKMYEHKPVFALEERKNNYVSIRKKDKKETDYEGFIGCVQVPSTFVVVRRNGRIAISGNTGEMGTSMYWSQPNTIFDETLLKMKNKLKQSGYVGYIDINTIVNGRDIYPLEWTARLGYPEISIQIDGVLNGWGDFLYSLAKKEKFDLKTKKGFQVGVVLAVPPFPFRDPDAFKKYSEDATIIFKKPNLDGVHLGDVKLVEGNFILAGISGYALIIVGTGTTMEEARKNVYNKISNVIIPNMFYRTDIGERWFSDSDKLFSWGYI